MSSYSVCLWLFGCPEYIFCVVSSKCSFETISVLWSQALGIRHSSGSGSKQSRWSRVMTVRVVRSIIKWSQHAYLIGTSQKSWLLYENSKLKFWQLHYLKFLLVHLKKTPGSNWVTPKGEFSGLELWLITGFSYSNWPQLPIWFCDSGFKKLGNSSHSRLGKAN